MKLQQTNNNNVNGRAGRILDAIDALLDIASSATFDTNEDTGGALSPEGEASNSINTVQQLRSDINILKAQIAHMPNPETIKKLQIQVDSLPKKQEIVAAVLAEISVPQPSSSISSSPCDTPEGLAGEIKGCP